MPSTIPYDPSLVLAQVVSQDAIQVVTDIAKAQAPADAAQDELNSLMASRRSLDMTKVELAHLSIDTKPIDAALEDLNKSITDAAVSYAKNKVQAEKTIAGLRSKIQSVHASVESPVDYMRTDYKSFALGADSMNMDVQYFSLDGYNQDADAFAGAVSNFVSGSFGSIDKIALQMGSTAQKQVAKQLEMHKIIGTLVIAVSCTHKNATVLDPFVLNVDKGIKVWNHLFPSDKLVPTNMADMLALAAQPDPDAGPRFSIISGVNYGSSFVGMVHILNVTDTSLTDNLSSMASNLQVQMTAANWLGNASGGFGTTNSVSDEVKNLLSQQHVTSHVTLITMGIIPSIVATDVKWAVQKFADFDPSKAMATIATLQNATAADQDSVQQSADAARTGQSMKDMQSAKITAALGALATTDDAANKVIDVNSMMTALEDYLDKAGKGLAGFPINYYLKDITKGMLAEMWVSKYFPGSNLAIQLDDSGVGAPAGSSGAAGTAPAGPAAAAGGGTASNTAAPAATGGDTSGASGTGTSDANASGGGGS